MTELDKMCECWYNPETGYQEYCKEHEPHHATSTDSGPSCAGNTAECEGITESAAEPTHDYAKCGTFDAFGMSNCPKCAIQIQWIKEARTPREPAPVPTESAAEAKATHDLGNAGIEAGLIATKAELRVRAMEALTNSKPQPETCGCGMIRGTHLIEPPELCYHETAETALSAAQEDIRTLKALLNSK